MSERDCDLGIKVCPDCLPTIGGTSHFYSWFNKKEFTRAKFCSSCKQRLLALRTQQPKQTRTKRAKTCANAECSGPDELICTWKKSKGRAVNNTSMYGLWDSCNKCAQVVVEFYETWHKDDAVFAGQIPGVHSVGNSQIGPMPAAWTTGHPYQRPRSSREMVTKRFQSTNKRPRDGQQEPKESGSKRVKIIGIGFGFANAKIAQEVALEHERQSRGRYGNAEMHSQRNSRAFNIMPDTRQIASSAGQESKTTSGRASLLIETKQLAVMTPINECNLLAIAEQDRITTFIKSPGRKVIITDPVDKQNIHSIAATVELESSDDGRLQPEPYPSDLLHEKATAASTVMHGEVILDETNAEPAVELDDSQHLHEEDTGKMIEGLGHAFEEIIDNEVLYEEAVCGGVNHSSVFAERSIDEADLAPNVTKLADVDPDLGAADQLCSSATPSQPEQVPSQQGELDNAVATEHAESISEVGAEKENVDPHADAIMQRCSSSQSPRQVMQNAQKMSDEGASTSAPKPVMKSVPGYPDLYEDEFRVYHFRPEVMARDKLEYFARIGYQDEGAS